METLDLIVSLLFLFTGLFSLIASVLNLNWFFQTRQTQTFVGWFGRTGARFFYGILGIALTLCGVFILFGYGK